MAAGFTSPLQVEYVNGKRWKVLQAFVFVTEGGEILTVPVGFETDFASIPRFLWAIYPPAGKWGKAAVVHDWLYASGDRTRLECDEIFKDAMEILGVPWLRRQVMYRAVRLGGGAAWDRHRKAGE
jgi:hypothetical protein